jgi:hypothetical protein
MVIPLTKSPKKEEEGFSRSHPAFHKGFQDHTAEEEEEKKGRQGSYYRGRHQGPPGASPLPASEALHRYGEHVHVGAVGHQTRPDELVPGPDEGYEEKGHQGRQAGGGQDPKEEGKAIGSVYQGGLEDLPGEVAEVLPQEEDPIPAVSMGSMRPGKVFRRPIFATRR